MIVYDVATKVFDAETFPQHTIADLNSGITFIVLFSHSFCLYSERKQTHTQKYTHTYTHTHTHTLTHTQISCNYSL